MNMYKHPAGVIKSKSSKKEIPNKLYEFMKLSQTVTICTYL